MSVEKLLKKPLTKITETKERLTALVQETYGGHNIKVLDDHISKCETVVASLQKQIKETDSQINQYEISHNLVTRSQKTISSIRGLSMSSKTLKDLQDREAYDNKHYESQINSLKTKKNDLTQNLNDITEKLGLYRTEKDNIIKSLISPYDKKVGLAVKDLNDLYYKLVELRDEIIKTEKEKKKTLEEIQQLNKEKKAIEESLPAGMKEEEIYAITSSQEVIFALEEISRKKQEDLNFRQRYLDLEVNKLIAFVRQQQVRKRSITQHSKDFNKSHPEAHSGLLRKSLAQLEKLKSPPRTRVIKNTETTETTETTGTELDFTPEKKDSTLHISLWNDYLKNTYTAISKSLLIDNSQFLAWIETRKLETLNTDNFKKYLIDYYHESMKISNLQVDLDGFIKKLSETKITKPSPKSKTPETVKTLEPEIFSKEIIEATIKNIIKSNHNIKKIITGFKFSIQGMEINLTTSVIAVVDSFEAKVDIKATFENKDGKLLVKNCKIKKGWLDFFFDIKKMEDSLVKDLNKVSDSIKSKI